MTSSRFLKIGLAALVLVARVGSVSLAEDPPESPAPENEDRPADSEDVPEEDPDPVYREEVAVSAEVGEAPLGSRSTILEPNENAAPPVNLTEMVSEVPSVSQNGQGGLFQTFSIRGVSRQRVTSLVSDMRISSERRAGVSLSFIDPLLMGSVDILLGPSTTFHGSGALGGAVQVAPREYEGWSAQTGYGTNGDERYVAAGGGGEHWSIGFASRKADDAEAADGSRLHTRFEQFSLVTGFRWGTGKHDFSVTFIPTYGEDIGKANTDFPEKTTDYPLERHQLLRFAVERADRWKANVFVHGQDLKTVTVDPTTSTTSVNESVDFGGRFEHRLNPDELTLRVGGQLYARRGVDAFEIEEDLSGADPPLMLRPLDGAAATELGAYAAVDWDWGKVLWEAGARLLWVEQEDAGFDVVQRDGWSGFVGLSAPIGDRIELRGNLGRAVRFPTLTEQFFSGTTPRGSVTGNPSLDEEISVNGEFSMRWLGRRVLFTVSLFRMDVSDYIERIEFAPDQLTWVNLTSGVIDGAELQGQYRPSGPWQILWGGHLMDGDGSDGEPLADVPPAELFAGAVYRKKRFEAQLRLAHRFARDRPGSGEKPIPAADLLSAAVTYRPAEAWSLTLAATNLLDELYFPAADRKAPYAQGRSIFVRVGWTSRP